MFVVIFLNLIINMQYTTNINVALVNKKLVSRYLYINHGYNYFLKHASSKNIVG